MMRKSTTILFAFFFLCLLSCDESEENDSVESIVRDVYVRRVELDYAYVTGHLFSMGNETIEDYGLVYGTEKLPTIEEDTKVSALTAGGEPTLGEFEGHLESLEEGTQYYVRAYAVSASETIYSQEKYFTVKSAKTWYSLDLNESLPGTSALVGPGVVANGKAYLGLGTLSESDGDVNPLYESDVAPYRYALTRLRDYPGDYLDAPDYFALDDEIYVVASPSWKYDIANGTWSQRADFDDLTEAHFFVQDEVAYAVGMGTSVLNLPEAQVWQYNAVQDTWTQYATLPYDITSAESYHVYAAVQWGETAYLVVATETVVEDETTYGTPILYEFDVDNLQFTQVEELTFPVIKDKEILGYGVASSNYVFIVSENGARIFQYDPTGDTWEDISASSNGSVYVKDDILFQVGSAYNQYYLD